MHGASLHQDARFTDKTKKLKNELIFPSEFSKKVDMTKVQWEVMKKWVARRLVELMKGQEDEVLINYVFSLTEAPVRKN